MCLFVVRERFDPGTIISAYKLFYPTNEYWESQYGDELYKEKQWHPAKPALSTYPLLSNYRQFFDIKAMNIYEREIPGFHAHLERQYAEGEKELNPELEIKEVRITGDIISNDRIISGLLMWIE